MQAQNKEETYLLEVYRRSTEQGKKIMILDAEWCDKNERADNRSPIADDDNENVNW